MDLDFSQLEVQQLIEIPNDVGAQTMRERTFPPQVSGSTPATEQHQVEDEIYPNAGMSAELSHVVI